MKQLLFLFAFLFTCYSTCQSQVKIYKLKITMKNGVTKSGYLRAVNDSVIFLSPQPVEKSIALPIAFKEIQSIRARDRHSLWKGVLFGGGAGAILGAIIGFATYQPPDCSGTFICFDFGPEYSAMGGAVIGMLSGSLIGLAVGSNSTEVQINNKSDSYDYMMGNLSKFIVTPK